MQNTIKKNIIPILVSVLMNLSGIPARSQNSNNKIQVSASATNFTMASASSLENAQTLTSAFTLAVFSKSGKCSIYGNVSASSTTSSTPMPASVLALQLNTISPAMAANFNVIPLSLVNQLLFQSANKFNEEDLTYNLILGPVGYDYAPGTYSFTILFTMTQP